MNKLLLNLTFVAATVGLLTSLSGSASAQLDPSKTDGQYQSNEQSATSSSAFGNSFNPLDLIHNANLRRSRGSDEFQEDTNTNLNQAADQFKKLQQQRLQNEQSNPTTPSKQ